MTTAPGAPSETETAAAGDLADLLRRVAARDAAAFAALYRQTQSKLYGVVARILTRGDLSGEALLEAYVRIWEKAGEFDAGKGSPIAWMATIARNRALDEIRRVRPTSLEDMPEGFEPAADEVDPLAARDRSERLAALLDCLRGLGVIDAAGVTRSPRLDSYDRAIVADATYAVTIEPPGGSPNGAPSGPPVFLGKLVPVGP